MTNEIITLCSGDSIRDVLTQAVEGKLFREGTAYPAGFIICAGIPENIGDEGQTVYFQTEIPEAKLLAIADWTKGQESRCEEWSIYLDVLLRFNIHNVEFSSYVEFLSELDDEFRRWEEAQDQEIRKKVRVHPVSEVHCVKGGDGIVYVMIRFTKDRMVRNAICSKFSMASY